MLDLIIKDGYVVFPGKGVQIADIGIQGGKIVAIADHLNVEAKEILDVKGKYVFPGIIDAHFHVGIYRPFSEDARSESASAAAGGVTTILSYFRSGRNYMNVSEPYSILFKKVLDQSTGNFYTDYGFHLAPILREHVEEIPKLVEEYGVSSFKYYMFYRGLNLKSEFKKGSVEQEYLLSDEPYDLGHMYNIMKKISELRKKYGRNIRLSIHAENPEIIRIHLERAKEEYSKGKMNPLQAYHNARPPIAERIAIIEAFELAHQTHCPINILHVSSKLALETINELKRQYPDVDVYVEVTPAHLILTVDSEAGVYGKVNPPIRTEEDKEYLWMGIKNGWVDFVGSDHAAIEKSKKGTDLWSAEPGFGATELILPVLITEGYIKRHIPLEKLALLVTVNPAKIYGLYGKKGDIALGFDADLTIVDLNKKRKIRAEDLHSAQDFTPFEGLELYGVPEITILRGHIIYSNGKFGEPIGQYIKRPVC